MKKVIEEQTKQAGVVKGRDQIEEEIRQRLAAWRALEQDKSPSSGGREESPSAKAPPVTGSDEPPPICVPSEMPGETAIGVGAEELEKALPATFCCSFCDKSQHDVRTLIMGKEGESSICDECIELCMEIVLERKDKKTAADVLRRMAEAFVSNIEISDSDIWLFTLLSYSTKVGELVKQFEENLQKSHSPGGDKNRDLNQ